MSGNNIPDPHPGIQGIPKSVLEPNIPLADRIRARAEDIAVQIQEMFPLKRFQEIVEANYHTLADGSTIDVSFTKTGIDTEKLKARFPHISETKIADYIRDFLNQQGPRDGMIYQWTDTHTLVSGRISCRLAKQTLIHNK